MRRFHIIWYVALALLLMVSCVGKEGKNKRYNPAEVAFAASYNALFEGRIYPSLVLGQANYHGNDSDTLFKVSVTAPADNAVLRIVIDSSALNYVTIFQEVLPKKGQSYTFEPLLKWKYDNLYKIRQQGSVDFTFTCFINDEEVDVKNLRLNYRSVNECLLSIRDTVKGSIDDYRWLFSAYVNEEHPYIDQILAETLEQGNVTRFLGYQSNEQAVKDQVFAIWYYALNRGISYSSISCTANPSRYANVQHIRFFDEVYNNRQANCIDACVFFASILRKIGLKPVIFVEPCHTYLGYYTDKKRHHIDLLETTITGWVNFPELDKSVDVHSGLASEAQLKKVAKYVTEEQMRQYKAGKLSLQELKVAAAKTLFQRATEYDKNNYEANKKYFTEPSRINYQILDIENLRSLVQPIGGQ